MIKIYCLINPLTDKVFYVGATKCHLKKRLSGHLSCAKFKERKEGVMKNRAKLINEIISNGQKPEILLLKEVLPTHTDYFEKYFYNLFISQGIELQQCKHALCYQNNKIASLVQK